MLINTDHTKYKVRPSVCDVTVQLDTSHCVLINTDHTKYKVRPSLCVNCFMNAHLDACLRCVISASDCQHMEKQIMRVCKCFDLELILSCM